MLPLFNTARKRSRTAALAFGEFSWRTAPTSRVKPTAIIDRIVGRPLKEDENLERNQLVGNALVDEMCDECRH